MRTLENLASHFSDVGGRAKSHIRGYLAVRKKESLIRELASAIENPVVGSSDSSYTAGQAALATSLGIAALVEGCTTVTFVPSAKIPSNCPPIMSDYGDRYDMDGRQRAIIHNGIDIVEEMGYPVIAAADGKVVIAGEHPTSGNRIFVYHGKDIDRRHIFTMYGHLKEIAVRGEQHVKRGDKLGTIGNTGSDMPISRRPHLHYFILVSKTGEYKVKGSQVHFGLTGWTDDDPHKFWLLNEKGEIRGFSKGAQYQAIPIRLTYPVPCK